jgi:hypothetical protein
MDLSTGWVAAVEGAAFVAGPVLLWRGWRGVPRFGGPCCSKCGYDLRGLDWTAPTKTCPECGSDVNAAKAVSFGRLRRCPPVMAFGLAVLCFGLFVALNRRPAAAPIRVPPRPRPQRSVETAEALIGGLVRNPNDVRSWADLERRYRDGGLKRLDVEAAIDHLIEYLDANPATQSSTPASQAWRGFINAVLGDNAVSARQLGRLCVAMHSPAPAVWMRARIRQGSKPRYDVRAHGQIDLVRERLALREVNVDGKPVEVRSITGAAGPGDDLSVGASLPFSGEILSAIAPGSHEVRFTFDRGYVSRIESSQPGWSPPGQADRWPNALAREVVTSTLQLEVVPSSITVVHPVTDPGLDPTKAISLVRIDVMPVDATTVRLAPELEVRPTPAAIMFQIFVEIEGKRQNLGTVGRDRRGTTSFSGGATMVSSSASKGPVYRLSGVTAEVPPPAVKAARVVFEPDAAAFEETFGIEGDVQFWGKPMVFENVPLDRHDLDKNGRPQTQPAANRGKGPVGDEGGRPNARDAVVVEAPASR